MDKEDNEAAFARAQKLAQKFTRCVSPDDFKPEEALLALIIATGSLIVSIGLPRGTQSVRDGLEKTHSALETHVEGLLATLAQGQSNV